MPITAPTRTPNQAMLKIQELSAQKQQEIFDFIDFITVRSDYKQSFKGDLQTQFINWRAKHESALQSLDEEWDDSWIDIRDKRDTGREFSWDD